MKKKNLTLLLIIITLFAFIPDFALSLQIPREFVPDSESDHLPQQPIIDQNTNLPPNIEGERTFGPYMRALQENIKANWNRPKDTISLRIIAAFTIDRNGNLLNLKLLKPSVSEEANNASIEAIKKTAPFAPLPKEYPGTSVDIEFTFDYNVFGADGSSQSYSPAYTYNGSLSRVFKGQNYKATYKALPDKHSKEAFKRYLRIVQTCLCNLNFEEEKPLKAFVQFEITNDGKVKNANIIKPSKNAKFNKEIIGKISKLAFSSFPKRLELNSITVDAIINNQKGVVIGRSI